MIDKFYAFLDDDGKSINLIDTLPKNWRNISGLCFMPDSELKELGWIKITDLEMENYTCSEELLNQFKYRLCDEVANLRWEAQTEAVTYNNNVYVLSEKTVSSLYQKRMMVANNLTETYNWKSRDGMLELTGAEIVSLTNTIHDYIQDCFDIESEFTSNILSKKSLKELTKLDWTITWPSTELV